MLVAVITTVGFVPVGASVTTEDSPADATRTEGPVQAHHDLASTLQAVDGELTDQAMLEAAHAAAEDQPTLGSDRAPDEMAPLLDQQQRNLGLAETLATESGPADDDLDTAIATAQHASQWQATTLDLDTADPIPLSGYDAPSQALRELANRHDATPTSEQLDELQGLDELADPVRSTLARTVDAFLALDTATQLAYADADRQALEELRDDDLGSIDEPAAVPASLDADPADGPAPPSPGERLAEAGVNLAPVLETRTQFLDAVHDLHEAVDEADIATIQACEPVQVAPAFSIDLSACDNTYTTDVALQLDAGGTDTYHNNAGGSNLAGGSCRLIASGSYASAALVDVGTGDEAYGNPDAPRACGANGGGYRGVGLLLDEAGDDTYTANSRIFTTDGFGTNGGGALGVGFLLDQAGNDTYTATGDGTNGGGAQGVGLLLDETGDDTYTAAGDGTNGGGYQGVGFLLDPAGDDTYTAGSDGTNGGGDSGGVGFLLDQAGDDTYTAGSVATNGGGDGGVGFLLDPAGDDTYTAGFRGTNGGGYRGVGLLLDAAGTDRYDDPEAPGGSCQDCTLVPKGLVGAQVDSDGLPDPSAEDCVPHPPIDITENQGPNGFILGHQPATGEPIYRPGSGVTAGEGTEEDPYVIEGWCIEDSLISSGIGINGTSAHVVIHDNVITGHDRNGVELDGAENVTIHDNTITGNDAGVRLSGSSDNNVVENNAITDNGDGVRLSESSDNAVQDNTIADNGDDGVVLSGSSGNVLQDNTVTDHGLDGVVLSGSSDNVVENNTVTGNDDGVRLSESSDSNAVRDNTLTDNGDGVRLSESSDNAVRDNTIADNGDDGVDLFRSGDNAVENNNIINNEDTGLYAVNLDEPVDATDNWWGHETGPSGGEEDCTTGDTADGQGDAIATSNAEVCFDPWRTSPNPDAGAGG